jgi:urease subunit alpha
VGGANALIYFICICFICPQQIEVAIVSGITPMIGGGTGSVFGRNVTNCIPGVSNKNRMLVAADTFLVDFVFWGRVNCANP